MYFFNRWQLSEANKKTPTTPTGLPFNPEPPKPLGKPGTRAFTLEELAEYDGAGDRDCYLSVKGVVYDVTAAKEMYGPGGGYSIFAAKDASVVSLSLWILMLLCSL